MEAYETSFRLKIAPRRGGERRPPQPGIPLQPAQEQRGPENPGDPTMIVLKPTPISAHPRKSRAWTGPVWDDLE